MSISVRKQGRLRGTSDGWPRPNSGTAMSEYWRICDLARCPSSVCKSQGRSAEERGEGVIRPVSLPLPFSGRIIGAAHSRLGKRDHRCRSSVSRARSCGSPIELGFPRNYNVGARGTGSSNPLCSSGEPRRADAERGVFRIHAAARGGIEQAAAGAAKAGVRRRQPQGRDAKGNRIVVERSGPIKIVSARR